VKRAGPNSESMWQRIAVVLIEAGEPLPTRLIITRLGARYAEVYPRLTQMAARGIIAREPSFDSFGNAGRDVLWTYTGEDFARNESSPHDLDA
jgi:hypothetical protein